MHMRPDFQTEKETVLIYIKMFLWLSPVMAKKKIEKMGKKPMNGFYKIFSKAYLNLHYWSLETTGNLINETLLKLNCS